MEENMRPLGDYLRWLREETGQNIPDMSALDGGAEARVLLMLNTPTPDARVIERENPDATAANVRTIHEGVLDREETLSWNAVPYYMENPKREVKKCRPYLDVLLSRLDALEVVVLCGTVAKQTRNWVREAKPKVVILETWHPTQQNFNLNRDARGHYTATIEAAAAILAANPRPPGVVSER